MITQTEIRSGREVKTLKDLGISANVTHDNLTVVYELDISQLPLPLDECCPLDWMTISLRVHNTVQL